MEWSGEGRAKRSTGVERFIPRVLWALFLSASLPSAVLAGSTSYQYDELGRLTAVISDSRAVQYAYDEAGNRTQVTLLTTPERPASLSVPSSSTTGNYTISWTAGSGTVTAHELYEATNSSFSGQVRVYSGAGISANLAGRSNGTYYYRVRACNLSGCSDYRLGSGAVSVTLPPDVPSSITVPPGSTSGNYTVSWGTAGGTVSSYQLYEATNPSFSGEAQVYSGTGMSAGLSGRGDGTYYYRIRACNGSACGGYRTGVNGVAVTLPPSVPASISVPSSSDTGNYTISWGSSTGNVTAYQLYESTSSSFSGEVPVYSGTGTSHEISGKTNGTYYYRVRACNGSVCSGHIAGQSGTAVLIVPPAAPSSITGPAMNRTGNYAITWSASAGASGYELWESARWGAFVKVYDGPNTAISFSNKSGGEYRYRARACNVAGCSDNSPTKLVTVCKPQCQ